jgi:redox-sensitive bicupin YhaK (pirin superfamily)
MTTLHFADRIAVQPMNHGTGFRALGIRGTDAAMSPYLMVDHYWMSQSTFGPHPHAGFCAVTYMFEDSETSFINRDSRGDHSLIRPGDLHWTIAGRGVVHDEVPETPGKAAHGLQLFVNLVAAKKYIEPAAIHLKREDIPELTLASGTRVRLPFGEITIDGTTLRSPVNIPTDATLVDVQMVAGGRLSLPIAKEQNVFIHAITGEASDLQHAMLKAGEARSVGKHVEKDIEKNNEGTSNTHATLELATVNGAHLAIFMGAPINEPVVRHGPFAMNTREQITEAIRAYQAGEMGTL